MHGDSCAAMVTSSSVLSAVCVALVAGKCPVKQAMSGKMEGGIISTLDPPLGEVDS